MIGFLLLAVVAVTPAVAAELTPLTHHLAPAPIELAHAFDSTSWVLLARLAGAVLLSWRLSELERDANPHAIGLALLILAVPVIWAGTHSADVAAASALRWGLAGAFVFGTAVVALRAQFGRTALATGFAVKPEPWLRPCLLVLFAVAAGVVVALSTQVAALGLNRVQPTGPDPLRLRG